MSHTNNGRWIECQSMFSPQQSINCWIERMQLHNLPFFNIQWLKYAWKATRKPAIDSILKQHTIFHIQSTKRLLVTTMYQFHYITSCHFHAINLLLLAFFFHLTTDNKSYSVRQSVFFFFKQWKVIWIWNEMYEQVVYVYVCMTTTLHRIYAVDTCAM